MRKIKIIFSAILSLGFFLVAENAQALTPVARFDVVPYQRIEYGSSLKIGVVAFSKPGIQKVEFSATGQGYSGGTKTVTLMSLNNASGVWEYWTTFSASEFSGNGSITITALVTDNQSNTRNLTLPLFVYGASAYVPVTIWMDATGGNDSTCVVNNESLPCLTFATAVTKIKAENGSVLDGAIIYLQEGTYPTENISMTSSAQWVTITKDPDADRNNVIITGGTSRMYSGYVKFDSVTLQSLGTSSYVIYSANRLWTNDCRKIGSGRWNSNSNPIQMSDPDNHWSTDDYTYDVDFAYQRAAIVRGATISTVGNDTFQNTGMVVNCTMDDSDHGTNYSTHNDGYQFFNTDPVASPPANNRIVYNYKATNMHYQGVFLHSEDGNQSTDNAFVNVVMEMRDDANLNESDSYPFTGLGLYDPWDHLIIWNCSFLWGNSAIYTANLTNSSIVGNVFFSLENTETSPGDPVVTSMAPGNAGNNEVLHNHFEWVYGASPSCSSLARSNDILPDPDKICPRYYAKRPDSDAGVSSTIGGEAINLDPESASFLYPVDDQTLIDRFTPRVPVDIFNVERGELSDVGAVEYASQSEPVETCSDGIQNQDETGIDCGGSCSACAVPTYQCNDGTDNDSDGATDYPDDLGCSSATDDDETNVVTYQCNDGADNDSDGLTDYPNDPGCSSATDNNETNVVSDSTAPFRYAGVPSGELAAGTTAATISLNTNESATCKYSASSGTAYASMTNTFSGGGSTRHTTTVSGLSNGSSYNYYARCVDASSNANGDDYQISFSVKSATVSNNNNSDSSDSGSSKKKKTVKKRTISVSKKSLSGGQVLIERGKGFSKSSPVLLYFSKSGGGYYPPMKIMTNKAGKFALSYKIPPNKPSGAYSWYAVDTKTGKKSKTIKFKVK